MDGAAGVKGLLRAQDVVQVAAGGAGDGELGLSETGDGRVGVGEEEGIEFRVWERRVG